PRAGVRGREGRLEEVSTLLDRTHFVGRMGAEPRGVGRQRVLETRREGVDKGIAEPSQPVNAPRLRLAHLGWYHGDGRTRPPLWPRDGIVVLSLDANLDRGVAFLDERIGRPEDVTTAVVLLLAVEPRQHAALLLRRAPQDEVYFAQPMVVGR